MSSNIFDMTVLGTIASAMVAVIVALWRYILTLQKKLEENQNDKLTMVLAETKDAKETALAAMIDEETRKETHHRLERLENKIDKLHEAIEQKLHKKE